jgi:hypothetical protein
MAKQELDREEMAGYLLTAWVSPHSLLNGATEAKRQAVERYMRTYLRALTRAELDFELRYTDANASLSPTIEFKIRQASKGYDQFMARRGVRVS